MGVNVVLNVRCKFRLLGLISIQENVRFSYKRLEIDLKEAIECICGDVELKCFMQFLG